jgi:hypothetical protein
MIPDRQLLDSLEAEIAAGWPEPWWPQDRPTRPAGQGTYLARRTRCCRGHDFDEANTLWHLAPFGRRCLACKRLEANGIIGPGVNESDPWVRMMIAYASELRGVA